MLFSLSEIILDCYRLNKGIIIQAKGRAGETLKGRVHLVRSVYKCRAIEKKDINIQKMFVSRRIFLHSPMFNCAHWHLQTAAYLICPNHPEPSRRSWTYCVLVCLLKEHHVYRKQSFRAVMTQLVWIRGAVQLQESVEKALWSMLHFPLLIFSDGLRDVEPFLNSRRFRSWGLLCGLTICSHCFT